ncbi:hypothetical protein LJR056_001616 [Paenibacillus sp. LjRoot56]
MKSFAYGGMKPSARWLSCTRIDITGSASCTIGSTAISLPSSAALAAQDA